MNGLTGQASATGPIPDTGGNFSYPNRELPHTLALPGGRLTGEPPVGGCRRWSVWDEDGCYRARLCETPGGSVFEIWWHGQAVRRFPGWGISVDHIKARLAGGPG